MKPKVKFDNKTNIISVHCEPSNSKNIENLIERFGIEITNTLKNEKETIFQIKVNSKDEYKKFNSLWKSAKQFI